MRIQLYSPCDWDKRAGAMIENGRFWAAEFFSAKKGGGKDSWSGFPSLVVLSAYLWEVWPSSDKTARPESAITSRLCLLQDSRLRNSLDWLPSAARELLPDSCACTVPRGDSRPWKQVGSGAGVSPPFARSREALTVAVNQVPDSMPRISATGLDGPCPLAFHRGGSVADVVEVRPGRTGLLLYHPRDHLNWEDTAPSCPVAQTGLYR